MGTHAKSIYFNLREWVSAFFIPSRKDQPLQILLKLISVISTMALIVSACCFTGYFISCNKQRAIINETQTIWHSKDSLKDRFNSLSAQNPDFTGWVSVQNTEIDNPVYKTNNNLYYKHRNQVRKRSSYGALFFDSENSFGRLQSRCLTIYGNSTRDGSMLTQLKYYRNLNFYKKNPVITLTTQKGKTEYIVFAVILFDQNEDLPQNNNFYKWYKKIYKRSIIQTQINITQSDSLLTLITDAEDFEGARLAVIAKKLTANDIIDKITANTTVNPKPEHPKAWYAEQNK